MADRTRVYELARELGLTSKELIELLSKEGVEVKSHASTIEDEYADLVRDQVIGQRTAVTKEKKEEAAPPAPVEEKAAVAEDAADEAEEEEEAAVDGTEIHLKPPITVRDLAKALGRKPNEIIGQLMTMNVFATINQVIEPDTAEKICSRYGFEFVRERRERAPKGPKRQVEAAETEEKPQTRKPIKGHVPRPPVVAFLGHVDHGKTSLLDAIRNTRVTAGEAGGITQHIGASVIERHGQSITFLDTPGHAAFTAMRARGANATDIVVLVVAADDGVMPQTAEAINHAKAAGVPIVVAMNKIDLPNANPDKVLLELQQNDVTPEEWGGQVGVVPVSALQAVGIEDLLERILLEAEVMELKANPSLSCDGIVIEAQLEPGMGPTASVLVRNGTLHLGDTMLCGKYYGRAKALIDQSGRRVKSAGPSTPVKVLGLSGVPEAGDALVTVADEREARALAEERVAKAREGMLGTTQQVSLEDIFQQIQQKSRAELKLIIKADVRGSLEAVVDSLRKLSTDKVEVDIVHRSVGEVTENDVLLAAASGAIIVGFHVRAMPGVNRAAKQQGVEIRLYSIIYELLEDIEAAMRGKLAPEFREEVIGQAEIKQIFDISKTGRICGCVVNQGTVRVGANARVLRDGEVIYKGSIHSLRHFRDEAREMRAGQECGIRLDNFEDFEVGDLVEVFKMESVAPQL
jgi:translation initiation factor IF-2